jgi:hypothetical protein
MNQLFKFTNLASAKFVVERLLSMGIKAEGLPSGYIRVFDLTEGAKKVIKDSLGTHVAATGVEDLSLAKHAGTGQGKKKLASKVEKPKSPPTANSKTLPKPGKTVKAQTGKDVEEATTITPNIQKMAYEILKRLVEKNPKGFPRLAKIMGIKVKA